MNGGTSLHMQQRMVSTGVGRRLRYLDSASADAGSQLYDDVRLMLMRETMRERGRRR